MLNLARHTWHVVSFPTPQLLGCNIGSVAGKALLEKLEVVDSEVDLCRVSSWKHRDTESTKGKRSMPCFNATRLQRSPASWSEREGPVWICWLAACGLPLDHGAVPGCLKSANVSFPSHCPFAVYGGLM